MQSIQLDLGPDTPTIPAGRGPDNARLAEVLDVAVADLAAERSLREMTSSVYTAINEPGDILGGWMTGRAG
jgi:hypothetical protein